MISSVPSEAGERWRPSLHIVAPSGWLNDPCAPGYDPVHGIYHLGFQWNPQDTEWGNISWGAALSQNLLTWEISKHPSMRPSLGNDSEGVFTGCMLPTTPDGVTDGTLTALYTSVSHLPIHYTWPYFRGSEAVALATSTDSGKTWTRLPNNIVLAEPPPGIDVTGWRDPFVAAWPAMNSIISKQRGKSYTRSLYAVVSGGIRGKTPTVFLYQVNACALDEWQYMGPLIIPGLNFNPSPRWTGDFGINWEVSNFVSLSNEDLKISRNFLICGVEGRLTSAGDIVNKGNFRCTKAQMWMCGSLEGGEVVHMKYRCGGKLDHGTFYAGNSFWDSRAREQVIFGWILEDDLESEVRREQGWAGVISLPRVLKLQVIPSVVSALSCPLLSIGSIELLPENEEASCFTVVTLCAIPDTRLNKLRGCNVSPNPNLCQRPLWPKFPEALSRWELRLDFEVKGDNTKMGFDIIHSTTEYTRIYFNPVSESIVVDRSKSSSQDGIRRCEEHAPHTLFNILNFSKERHSTGQTRLETLEFHVLYDCSVLEIFVNERTALTTRVYSASGTSTGILPFVERGNCACFGSERSRILKCDLWPLSQSV
ncbi:glycosyl hydrolase [Clohesyomyces aquaticus]|uniref:Glycosyl hydrolase n=1 Tax=Clohesyomyces aquaticus TaxID=1231657 RepID=A0A1Y1YJV6_9PLEO|nr:glycosyl hydrolase [Clohesyomyces aquaticus]